LLYALGVCLYLYSVTFSAVFMSIVAVKPSVVFFSVHKLLLCHTLSLLSFIQHISDFSISVVPTDY